VKGEGFWDCEEMDGGSGKWQRPRWDDASARGVRREMGSRGDRSCGVRGMREPDSASGVGAEVMPARGGRRLG
jgi:hypothetical protein